MTAMAQQNGFDTKANPTNKHDSTHPSTHEHLQDWPNYAGFSTTAEQREPKRLNVSGTFPSYVQGTLYRTGPGTHKVTTDAGKDFSISHWFDGFTVMHRFSIVPNNDGSNNPSVYYNSRCQVDSLLEHARETGKLIDFSFGQKRDPCDSFWKKVKSTFHKPPENPKPDNVNVGVALNRIPGNDSQLNITTDNPMMKQFDAETLEPMGVTKQQHLHPALKGQLSATHPGFDPVTGDIYNYNLEFGRFGTYRIFKTDAKTGKSEILTTITDKDVKPAYIHSSFITESFYILCVWPCLFKAAGASILWNNNLLDAMYFDDSAKCTWLVVDRKFNRGLVKKFVSPAMFAFHTINAWEEKDNEGNADVYCELIQYKNLDILHRFYYDNLMSIGSGAKDWSLNAKPSTRPNLTRYKLGKVPVTKQANMLSGKAEEAQIARQLGWDSAGELPTINPSYATKQHRYTYGIGDRGLSSFVDCLVKSDLENETRTIWEHPKHTPGEAIFIENPEAKSEDDGVLLSVVLDGEKGTSYLLCLDAQTMTEVARAEVDEAVGFGFHGMHIANGGTKA